MKLETRAVHAGPPLDPKSGEVVPPIHVSTTFGRDENSQRIGDHFYIRESNPNQEYLEKAIADPGGRGSGGGLCIGNGRRRGGIPVAEGGGITS